MALYNVRTVKVNSFYNIGPFGNNYHVSAASPADALDALDGIVAVEIPLFSTDTLFIRVHATEVGSPGHGASKDINLGGTRTPAGAILPPWNVCRVSFKAVDNAYRMPKYLRIGLGEGDVDGQLLETSIRDLLDDYADAIVDSTIACSPDGDSLETGAAVVYPYIAMRQTDHQRAARPGYHRGWIPD